MTTTEIRETIPATAEAVFELIQEYERRLEWDTLLSETRFEPGFARAGKGAIAVCRDKRILSGFTLRTVYVSFEKGKVAAVKMLNQPPFFRSFAASIRHVPVSDEKSEVIYKVNFSAKPEKLCRILHPLMRHILIWEIGKRLRTLKKFFLEKRAV